jgi:hypothetical protein
MPATHLLVAREPDRVIEEFLSYGAALAAWEAVTEVNPGTIYEVRSVEDPRWKRAPVAQRDEVTRVAFVAARAWRRKEISATAAALLRSHADESLHQVMAAVKTSCRDRGIELERHEAQDAVKGRVTIGRCRKGSWSGGCDRAYWMPKSAGRLADQECPHCHRRLAQTTLAYGAAFRSLVAEKAKVTA